MKVLLALTALGVCLASCEGACFADKLNNTAEACTDPYNGTKYPFGSTWNTTNCMKCECNKHSMTCCDRHGGIAHIPGCTGFVDKNTCTYKFHKVGDPSKPCKQAENDN